MGALTSLREWRVGVAVAIAAVVVLHFTLPLLLFLLFAIVFALLGAMLALLQGSYVRRPKSTYPQPPKPNIKGTLSRIKIYPPPAVRPTIFTTNVDNHVHEVLCLVLHHHAIPTYRRVGRDDEAFFSVVIPVIWSTLSSLMRQTSHIDTMKVTQDMMEVIRDHFEHFRGFHFRQIQTKFPQLHLYPYLESPDHELNFLRQACEVLLCVCLPKEYLQCTPIRVLIREYLTCHIFQPTIEMLCDPDYINQKLLSYLTRREEAMKSAQGKYYSRTYEDFVKNIKKIDDLMELHQMRQFIITDIIQAKAVLKMKSTRNKGLGGGAFPIPIPAEKVKSLMERDLGLYVNQLQTAKTVCERQIRKLGGEDYDTDTPQSSDKLPDAPQGMEGPVTLFPFDVVVSNSVARQLFHKFLAQWGFAHLVNFWEDVQKLTLISPDALHKSIKEILERYLIQGAEFPIYAEGSVVEKVIEHLEGEVRECVPLLMGVQGDIFFELQEQFYPSFTCSSCYLELLQLAATGSEGGTDELRELGKYSEGAQAESAPLDPTLDESHYKVKLQSLRQELEEKDDALASMPETISSSSLAQRKKALNKDRDYLNEEIKKLEHYIDHTDEWFGTVGKWDVQIHSVDVSTDNERDPLFIIVVHRPEISRRQQMERAVEEEGKEMGRGGRAMMNREEMGEEGDGRDIDYLHPSHMDTPTQSLHRRGSASPVVGSPQKRRRRRSSNVSSEGGVDESFDVIQDDEAMRKQSLAGWVVGRRLSEFQHLHSKVAEVVLNLSLPPLPKWLNPFQKPDAKSKYWQKYRAALELYLRLILKDSRMQESEEVFNFLSPASENLRQSSLIHPERKRHTFSLSVPRFSKDEEDSSITDHLYLLMSEIFELDDWSRVLRKQVMDFVQLTYGKNLHRSMQESVNWVISEPMLIFYLETFREAMWPNGQPAPPSPIRSDEQKALTKDLAKKKFLKSSPQGLQTILGQRNCQIGMLKIFESLQDPRANKQLFYGLFELLLYAVVPELQNVEVEEAVADWKGEV